MSGVDDAEAIALGVGEHHEVGIGRVMRPVDTSRAEAHQSLDLRGLIGSIAGEQVEVRTGRFGR